MLKILGILEFKCQTESPPLRLLHSSLSYRPSPMDQTMPKYAGDHPDTLFMARWCIANSTEESSTTIVDRARGLVSKGRDTSAITKPRHRSAPPCPSRHWMLPHTPFTRSVKLRWWDCGAQATVEIFMNSTRSSRRPQEHSPSTEFRESCINVAYLMSKPTITRRRDITASCPTGGSLRFSAVMTTLLRPLCVAKAVHPRCVHG